MGNKYFVISKICQLVAIIRTKILTYARGGEILTLDYVMVKLAC